MSTATTKAVQPTSSILAAIERLNTPLTHLEDKLLVLEQKVAPLLAGRAGKEGAVGETPEAPRLSPVEEQLKNVLNRLNSIVEGYDDLISDIRV